MNICAAAVSSNSVVAPCQRLAGARKAFQAAALHQRSSTQAKKSLNSKPEAPNALVPGAGTRLTRLHAALPDLPDLDDLDIPDLLTELEEAQAEQGAVLDDAGLVAHFKNDSRAMHALKNAAVVVDRSHWGRLRLAGDDRLAFLHGQTTNDIQQLKPGTGCDTVFVTAQARTLDLATVYAQPSGTLLVVSPGMKGPLLERLQKYIFPADKVQVMDISARTCMFSLLGPQADAVMQQLQAGSICDAPYGSHMLLSLSGKPVIVAVGGGLPGTGYTFICDESIGANVWKALTAQEGVEPMGNNAWQMARVLAGRPAPGAELTEDVNPLEAGLYHAVSVQKGCYIGQETIAKVHNLNAVKQQLWALDMQTPCAVGDEVAAAADGRKLGHVTSYVDTPSGQHRALAYLKCRVAGEQVDLEGQAVSVAGARGFIVAPPFLSRGFADGAADQPAAEEPADAAAAAEEEAKEAARRAEKLRQMQERLAAFQAAQAAAAAQQQQLEQQ